MNILAVNGKAISPASGKAIADVNLIPENIKKDVSIFGVTGTFAGGGGVVGVKKYLLSNITSYSGNEECVLDYAFGGCEQLSVVSMPQCTYVGYDAFIQCTRLQTISFPACIYVHNMAFALCTSLESAIFPMCNYIVDSAFFSCANLVTASFPVCEDVGQYAFAACSKLTTVSFPQCSQIGSNAFYGCTSLTTASFPQCTTIQNNAFQGCMSLSSAELPMCSCIYENAFHLCWNLISLYLMSTAVCSLMSSNAFGLTPIGGYSATAGRFGSIYVPASLLTSYQNATNWTYFSSRFVGV